VDWIIASAEVKQGHPAPEERSHERPLALKVVQHAVAAVGAVSVVVKSVAALWNHVDSKKRYRGL